MAQLRNLEEDLTCSICLCTFDCPVTLPCGHNFCLECLQKTWEDCCTFCCPKCRASFSTRPELKKNTDLSTIVETFSKLEIKSEAKDSGEKMEKVEKDEKMEKVEKAGKENAVLCDTCMEAEASKTCLTCMASFCEEHLRPHQMNPVFALHQLTLPVGNLLDWVCHHHHKLMDFFCSQHSQTICSLCLQQTHKGCSTTSVEEQRNLRTVSPSPPPPLVAAAGTAALTSGFALKVDLKDKLVFLDKKIAQNQKVIGEMSNKPDSLKVSVAL